MNRGGSDAAAARHSRPSTRKNPMSDPFLRRPDVERQVGLKKSAIYERMAEGTFPKPVRLGRRAVAWRASDIEKWKSERPLIDA